MGYSQFGEDDIAIKFFGDRLTVTVNERPRFLDIGAHDGISASNTRRLAELGCGGTLVEPSPLAFVKLLAVYRDRTDVNLVNAGLVPIPAHKHHDGLARFYESGGMFVGTFDDRHRDAWEGKQHVHYRPIFVGAMRASALCDALPGPYHFVSIDVEGLNVALFEAFQFQAIGAELICIEHDDQIPALLANAAEQGYVEHARTAANLLLKRA